MAISLATEPANAMLENYKLSYQADKQAGILVPHVSNILHAV